MLSAHDSLQIDGGSFAKLAYRAESFTGPALEQSCCCHQAEVSGLAHTVGNNLELSLHV